VARVVVCGYMIRHPVAGNLLAYFQYVLGLHRLGHEVAYVEESGWAESCYDPSTGELGGDPTPGLRRVRRLFAEQRLAVPICYVDRETGTVHGTTWSDLNHLLGSADLLLNLGGVCWLPEFRVCRRRALVDMDPFFTQVGQFGAWLLDDHDAHFSYGANIGRPGCSIPTAGVDWLPTVPPVVTNAWHGSGSATNGKFTTVANWSAYGGVIHDGERYGQKDEEFLRLLDLPKRTPQPLELVLAGVPGEVATDLREAGWSVRGAGDPEGTEVPAYRTYIQASRGELSAAKHAYVKTRSGWFSDRSVCYLASGRPVVVQDTGFGDWLPTGCGVFAFSSVEEAADRLDRVNAEYDLHSRAARDIAERVFGHDVVLPNLLDAALGGRVIAPIGSGTERLG
jgi:hypothetical protein